MPQGGSSRSGATTSATARTASGVPVPQPARAETSRPKRSKPRCGTTSPAFSPARSGWGARSTMSPLGQGAARRVAQFSHVAVAAEAGTVRDRAADQQLRARLDRVARADKRLLDAYEAGAVTLAELSERRHHLADERLALERQQQERDHLRRQRVQAEAVRTSLEAFCDRIHARLNEATFADKQAILQLVIERIIVGDGRLEIRHVIPLRPPQPGRDSPGQPAPQLRTDRVHPAALAARLGPHLLKGLPEAECAIRHCEFRPDGQPAPPDVEQQVPPGLHTLAHAIGQADELLLALRGGADDHEKALGVRFEAGLHVDAVNPKIDVAFGREIALGPPGMLARPSLLQSGDTRGGQPTRVRAEQRRQRVFKVAAGDALEVQDRDQNLEAL